MMKYAVIDIGSNSVRLMLRANGKTLYKRVCTTRLGEGIAASPVLGEAPMARTLEAVLAFAKEGRSAGAEVLAFATAAVRSAKNGAEFCARARALGVEVEVVSGEEEAKLAAVGALGSRDGGIVDIGGASAEYLLMRGGRTEYSVSMPVGCVRLYDSFADRAEALEVGIHDILSRYALPAPSGPLFAVGGTASTLACVRFGLRGYDAERLNGLPLPLPWVRDTASRLLSMTAEERAKVKGMDERRADIIAGGALLLEMIMERAGVREVLFSDADNLEGYLALRRGA